MESLEQINKCKKKKHSKVITFMLFLSCYLLRSLYFQTKLEEVTQRDPLCVLPGGLTPLSLLLQPRLFLPFRRLGSLGDRSGVLSSLKQPSPADRLLSFAGSSPSPTFTTVWGDFNETPARGCTLA